MKLLIMLHSGNIRLDCKHLLVTTTQRCSTTLASGGGTMEEHFPSQPKAEGSSPANHHCYRERETGIKGF